MNREDILLLLEDAVEYHGEEIERCEEEIQNHSMCSNWVMVDMTLEDLGNAIAIRKVLEIIVDKCVDSG